MGDLIICGYTHHQNNCIGAYDSVNLKKRINYPTLILRRNAKYLVHLKTDCILIFELEGYLEIITHSFDLVFSAKLFNCAPIIVIDCGCGEYGLGMN